MATEKELFENLLHVGHTAATWNPKMKKYLYKKINGTWVFDLEKTKEGLEKAEQFMKALKLQNKKVLFVGTKPQDAWLIQELLGDKQIFYVDKKWTPGLLTNFKEIRKRVDYYLDLKSQFETGDIMKYTKKEVASFKKDLDKLSVSYGGVAEMRKKPDAVIILDGFIDRIAIDEAFNSKIPTIALADANINPDRIDYLVPGNDDAVKSIRFFIESMVKCLS